jgi:hypothetical protein
MDWIRINFNLLFYCDPAAFLEASSAQLQCEELFVEELKVHKVSVVKLRIGKKNDLSPKHDWIDTAFFSLFDESHTSQFRSGAYGSVGRATDF